jgi:hypothetical protein
MKKLSVIFWSWAWFVLANVADVLTSLQRWGGEEENPYFRDSAHHFMAWHSVVGKGTFAIIMAVISYLAYRLMKPLNENVATILACVIPLYYAWSLWQVADNNFFWVMRWVHP